MQQQGGGGGSQIRQLRRGQPTGATILTRWVGHYVVLKYLAGPAMPADPQDPRSLAVSEPGARSGVFHLQRFGQLGIEVCNTMGEGMLNRSPSSPGKRCSPLGAPQRRRGPREGRANEGAGSPARHARQRLRAACIRIDPSARGLEVSGFRVITGEGSPYVVDQPLRIPL
jgi:hypothetical protein